MNKSDLTSKIIVCSDVEHAKEQVLQEYSLHRVCSFVPEKDEFLLENTKEALKEAYISESDIKVIVLAAKSYRVEAQNALLKALEEPPKNIIFILIAAAKSVLLPTIRSRVPLQEIIIKKTRPQSGLNLKNLHENEIYEFIQGHSKMSKSELKEMLQAIVYEAVHQHGIHFTHKEFQVFQRLLELSELNSRTQNIFATLLLSIMKRKHQ